MEVRNSLRTSCHRILAEMATETWCEVSPLPPPPPPAVAAAGPCSVFSPTTADPDDAASPPDVDDGNTVAEEEEPFSVGDNPNSRSISSTAAQLNVRRFTS